MVLLDISSPLSAIPLQLLLNYLKGLFPSNYICFLSILTHASNFNNCHYPDDSQIKIFSAEFSLEHWIYLANGLPDSLPCISQKYISLHALVRLVLAVKTNIVQNSNGVAKKT